MIDCVCPFFPIYESPFTSLTFKNNPTRKGFGGSRSSEDISLKPVVCQTISRMLHNKHPRCVTSLQCMNSALSMVHHLPGKALVSSNALGDSFR